MAPTVTEAYRLEQQVSLWQADVSTLHVLLHFSFQNLSICTCRDAQAHHHCMSIAHVRRPTTTCKSSCIMRCLPKSPAVNRPDSTMLVHVLSSPLARQLEMRRQMAAAPL